MCAQTINLLTVDLRRLKNCKIIILIIGVLTYVSCKNSSKHDEKPYKKCFQYGDNNTFCYYPSQGLTFYFDKNDELFKIRDDNKIDYYFKNGNINEISKIQVPDETGLLVAYKFFFSDSMENRIEYYDSIYQETIWIDTYKNKTVKTKVFRYLPEPINRDVIVSYFDILPKGDTTKYFYYTRDESFFHIKTDRNHFNINNKDLDYFVIDYTSDTANLEFYTPEQHIYVASYTDKQTDGIIKNALSFKTDSNVIVGSLWSFAEKDTRKGHYQLIYFQGDLMARIKEKNSRYSYLKAFESKTIQNKELFNLIIETGEYEISNGILNRR